MLQGGLEAFLTSTAHALGAWPKLRTSLALWWAQPELVRSSNQPTNQTLTSWPREVGCWLPPRMVFSGLMVHPGVPQARSEANQVF